MSIELILYCLGGGTALLLLFRALRQEQPTTYVKRRSRDLAEFEALHRSTQAQRELRYAEQQRELAAKHAASHEDVLVQAQQRSNALVDSPDALASALVDRGD